MSGFLAFNSLLKAHSLASVIGAWSQILLMQICINSSKKIFWGRIPEAGFSTRMGSRLRKGSKLKKGLETEGVRPNNMGFEVKCLIIGLLQ